MIQYTNTQVQKTQNSQITVHFVSNSFGGYAGDNQPYYTGINYGTGFGYGNIYGSIGSGGYG